ncbi:MAG: metallophosphoesterase family protein [Chloroflexi bacterium]|nr:metallophosphoesterase family protein [Chloroflexota bacterium]
MRLALFSDIHGNLTAFEAALADLQALGGADHTWVLGDLAAFGGRPAECVRRVAGMKDAPGFGKVQVIGGNTDRYLVNGTRFRSPSAKDAEELKKLAQTCKERDTILNWNLEQLGFEDYDLLKKIRGREISEFVEGYGWVIGYHGTPGNDEGWLWPDTPAEEVSDALLDREGRLAIGGHTHKAMDREVGRWRVVNPGSVGLSFELPGVACWGLLTFAGDSVHVDLRRVPYDVEAAIADLSAAGYPLVEWAAARLRPKA